MPGSILCTMSTMGGYIGAIPCATISKTNASEIENPILVYPNPASTHITIGILPYSNFTLEMRNTLGELVLRSPNINTLDISKYPNGIYIIKVMTGYKTYSVQLIKV
ncbi:MAG: T9SS type A sorting domain-containing protein [Lewinellaceae bacterium]|nr:T9SS type A sorting domain-containing protein [Lewinellaceae bacterium]